MFDLRYDKWEPPPDDVPSPAAPDESPPSAPELPPDAPGGVPPGPSEVPEPAPPEETRRAGTGLSGRLLVEQQALDEAYGTPGALVRWRRAATLIARRVEVTP
jgi:hypothetical protein